MSQIRSLSLARCYGKARVARVWKILRPSVYPSLTPPTTIACRPGPVGAWHGYRTPGQVRADQCRLDPNATALAA
jgi:hypothetical protein